MADHVRKTKAVLLAELADAEKRLAKAERDLRRSERDNIRLMQLIENGELSLRNQVAAAIADVQANEPARTKTWYSHPAITARAQAAHARTSMLLGGRSWSEYVESAVLRETIVLEGRYNDGKQFEPVQGSIRPGRSATNRTWGSRPRHSDRHREASATNAAE